jgi:hypothetical protein
MHAPKPSQGIETVFREKAKTVKLRVTLGSF